MILAFGNKNGKPVLAYAGMGFSVTITAASAFTPVVTTVTGPFNPFRTQVELRNARGRLVKIFSKELEAVSWSYDRIGGCGAFRITLKEKADTLPLGAYGDHDARVYLGPLDGSTMILWFRGYLDMARGRMDLRESVDLTGFGYIRQLDRFVVNKSYQGREVAGIVTDILETFVTPNCDITYEAADIEVTSVTATSIIFNTTAAQAIKTLSDLVGSREWGVDRNLKFYFKRRLEYPKTYVFVKRDITRFEDVTSYDEIKNSLFLQGKNGFTYALEQSESIALWGKRQAIIINSSITNATDAAQLLNALFSDGAKPRRQLRAEVARITQPIEYSVPLGKVSIMGEDLQGSLYGEKKYGEFLYGYPYQAQINTVSYTLIPGGVRAAIQAAYLPPQIGKSLKEIETQLEGLREA